MMIRRSQQGSVILYAMLAMTVMLTISLAISNLLLSKLRSSQQASNSVGAIYAANSATELCLYEARHAALEPAPRVVFANGATFQITNSATSADITPDCSALGASFGFRATGTYRGVSRTLEASQ